MLEIIASDTINDTRPLHRPCTTYFGGSAVSVMSRAEEEVDGAAAARACVYVAVSHRRLVLRRARHEPSDRRLVARPGVERGGGDVGGQRARVCRGRDRRRRRATHCRLPRHRRRTTHQGRQSSL